MELSQSPVILITGASSGIGAAAARHFCQRGWRAVLAARRKDRLEELVAEIRADGGEALAVATDVTVVEQLQPWNTMAASMYCSTTPALAGWTGWKSWIYRRISPHRLR
jgi:NADP-dependent 3-hydroxy acid dehydrogenase YdfG